MRRATLVAGMSVSRQPGEDSLTRLRERWWIIAREGQVYAITTDETRSLVRVTLSGFFSPDEVGTFMCDLRDATIAIGCANGGHVVLVDTRDCTLQSQEVVGAFRQLIASTPYRAKRVALVTGQSVSRMQARRLLVDDRVRMFESVAEAMAWLSATSLHLAAAPNRTTMTPMRGY